MRIRVRISDNVLDEIDWPVYELELLGGFVERSEIINPGAYGRDFIGMTEERLLEWLSWQCPSHYHPEEYHDIWSPKARRFVDFKPTDEVIDYAYL